MSSEPKGDRCLSSSPGISKPPARRVPNRLFEVHRVPEHDGGDDEIQSAGAQPLIIECAVVDHAAAVEAHGETQRILRFTLVQSDGDSASEIWAVEPFEHERADGLLVEALDSGFK